MCIEAANRLIINELHLEQHKVWWGAEAKERKKEQNRAAQAEGKTIETQTIRIWMIQKEFSVKRWKKNEIKKGFGEKNADVALIGTCYVEK